MELDNTHLEKASRRIHAWNSLLGEMNYVCCKKRVNKELKKRCVMTHQHLQMVGLFLWEWDIKVAWYWFLGTINMKPLHLSICCSAVCLPLKSVIMTPQLMAVDACIYSVFMCTSLLWDSFKAALLCFLCMSVYIPGCGMLFHCTCVFTAEADRSCNSDRMQATPTRPCMLTAAGREKEQLLMSFQYKEPTLSLAFYLSILLYLYVHLLFY